MLFDSSLRKDLARQFVATVVVLVTIVMTILLIRTLGQASRGAINPAEVLFIMGFSLLSQLTTVLALSLFITIIATFSRMYADSEMAIWLTGGQGMLSFVRPVLRFAWPIWIAVTLLALFAWPWSNQQVDKLKKRHEQRGDVERVAPGRFQESAGGQRVFFIDKDAPDQNTGTNVFIAEQLQAHESTTTARRGQIEWRDGERVLVLDQGEQWQRNHDTGQMRWTQFERYSLMIDSDNAPLAGQAATRVISTLDLLRSPTALNLGELSWRLGLGLCALNFCLLAMPLSAVKPRAGRSYQFLLALLIFIVYYNAINIGHNQISNGKLPFGPWLLGLHGSIFVLAVAWLWGQHRQWSWRDLRPRQLPAGGAA